MVRINSNYTGVPDHAVVPPAGTYRVNIYDIEVKTKDEPDALPYWAVKLKIADPIPNIEGYTIFENLTSSPKMIWRQVQFLKSAGINTDGVVDIELNELIGRVIMVKTYQNEWQGNKNLKVKEFMPNTVNANPSSVNEAFGALFGSENKEVKKEEVKKEEVKKEEVKVAGEKSSSPKTDDLFNI